MDHTRDQILDAFAARGREVVETIGTGRNGAVSSARRSL
jgi:hypothetical protein